MSGYGGTPFIPPLATPVTESSGPSHLPPAPAPPLAHNFPANHTSPYYPSNVQYTPNQNSPRSFHTPSPNILPNGLSSDFTGYPPTPSESPPTMANPQSQQLPHHMSPWPAASNNAPLPGANMYAPPPSGGAQWPGAPPNWMPQQQGGYPGFSPYQSPYPQQQPQLYNSPWANNLPAGFMPTSPAGGSMGGIGGQQYTPFSPGNMALPGSFPGYPPGPGSLGGIGGMNMGGASALGMNYSPAPSAGHPGMGVMPGGGMPGGMPGGMGGMPGGMGGMPPGMGGMPGGMGGGMPGGMPGGAGGMGMGMPPPANPAEYANVAMRNLMQANQEFLLSQQMLQQAASQPPPPLEVPMGRGRSGDRMPKFTAGNHYGPALEPFLIHRLKVKLEINPVLEPMPDDMTSREYLKWDMRFRTNACQSSKDAGNVSWSAGREEPATFPRVTTLFLVSRLVPFIINVPAENPNVGVTCGEVIDYISKELHQLIPEAAFKELPAPVREQATKSYYHNRSTHPSAPGGSLRHGMRKMDIFCSKTSFGGLRVNDRLALEKYSTHHPCVFELLSMDWPMDPEEERDLQARTARAPAQENADVEQMRTQLEGTSLGAESTTRRGHSRQPSNTPAPSHAPSSRPSTRQR